MPDSAGVGRYNGEENRIGEGLKAIVVSQGLKASGPTGRWEQSPGPYKMHASSPHHLICDIEARPGKGWDGTGAADDQGSPHLTSLSLLFPLSASALLPCCRLPSRKESRAPT